MRLHTYITISIPYLHAPDQYIIDITDPVMLLGGNTVQMTAGLFQLLSIVSPAYSQQSGMAK